MSYGRVVGARGSTILANNVAWDGMQATGGVNITAAQAKTAALWTTTTATWEGWDATVWDIADGRLPILRNVGGNQTANNPPTHLQE